MRVTMTNINKAVADLDYEIVRGQDYFYFAPRNDAPALFDSMVCTSHLSTYTVEEWKELLVEKIEETKFENGDESDAPNTGVIVLAKRIY